MTISTERSIATGLQALFAAVAASPIIPWPPRAPAVPLGDWATVRRSGDADAYVLAWIASHVRDNTHPSVLH